MRTHSRHLSIFILLFLLATPGFAGSALAKGQGLNCPCTACTYTQGRAQTTYSFDADFNATAAGRAAYNNAEATAMKAADDAAASAIVTALKGAPTCPQPCMAQPFWGATHGKPFAGGTGGSGIARSLWKITYTCVKVPILLVMAQPGTPAPPPPDFCVGCTTQVVSLSSSAPPTQPQAGSPPAPPQPQPPQVCSGPNCTNTSPAGSGSPPPLTCRGPDGDAKIVKIESDMSLGAPSIRQLLSLADHPGRQYYNDSAVPAFLYGSSLLDSVQAKQLLDSLQTQAQRVDEHNNLTLMLPCQFGTSSSPPLQPGEIGPNGLGYSLRWSFGGSGDHGSGDHGGRGGSDSGQHKP